MCENKIENISIGYFVTLYGTGALAAFIPVCERLCTSY